jgi:hypothetical protein
VVLRGESEAAHPYDLLFGRPKVKNAASLVPILRQD